MAIYNAKFSDNKLEPTEAYDDGTFGTTKKLTMTEDEVRAAGPWASALGWLAHAHTWAGWHICTHTRL